MASGDSMGYFGALGYEVPPSGTAYAQFLRRNGRNYLAFDQTTIEEVRWSKQLPFNYGGSGLTVDILWIAVPTTGDVKWGISIERQNEGNHDFDSDNFATEQVATTTCSGTSGVEVKTTITVSNGANMDNAAAGDSILIRLRRIASDAADTMNGDAQFRIGRIKET